ncbi:MAG: acyl-CoA dehydratase activase-related protein, partial [Deltaproteobacteria bacterium]
MQLTLSANSQPGCNFKGCPTSRASAAPGPVVVGIPRGLLYFRYQPLWATFFSHLGIDILVS